jgi:hypothetical protein
MAIRVKGALPSRVRKTLSAPHAMVVTQHGREPQVENVAPYLDS